MPGAKGRDKQHIREADTVCTHGENVPAPLRPIAPGWTLTPLGRLGPSSASFRASPSPHCLPPPSSTGSRTPLAHARLTTAPVLVVYQVGCNKLPEGTDRILNSSVLPTGLPCSASPRRCPKERLRLAGRERVTQSGFKGTVGCKILDLYVG